MTCAAQSRALGLAIAVIVAVVAQGASAAPQQRTHGLEFRVHVDLVDAGAGEGLAFWDALLTQRAADASAQLEGSQGPVDTTCCTRLVPSTVTTFGSSGDGFDVIDSGNEFDLLLATFGDGSPANPLAYVVLSLTVCDTIQSADILGCALTPGDAFLVDVDDTDGIGLTIAHERGHNTGLVHPEDRIPAELDADLCRLMSAASGAGCLADFECNAFRGAPGATTSGTCACLGDSVGDPPLPDGLSCSAEPGAGICSGGLCGDPGGFASLSLAIGGGTEDPQLATPDDLISMSALTGGWSVQAAIGEPVQALVWDPDGEELLAILGREANDDLLVRLAGDGSFTPIGSLGRVGVVGLTWGPGRKFLYASFVFEPDPVNDPGFFATDLLRVDPSDAAVARLGSLGYVIGGTTGGGRPFGGAQSLAYDPDSDTLWGSTILGLIEIDASCDLPGERCAISPLNDLPPEMQEFEGHFGLEFDPERGVLLGLRDASVRFDSYYIELGFLGELETFDPATLQSEKILHQAFTGSSLALQPLAVPEPGGLALGLMAAGALLGLARRRQRR